MIIKTRELVSFDWAMKKLLRNKANFSILEGFLSELLNDDIKIIELLDTETNKKNLLDKFSRVDLLVKDHKGELIIIEVQYEREFDYFHRALYNTSKILIEHVGKGMEYGEIKKIISVNIVYFDLGQGEDYIYKGTMQCVGLHKKDTLQLNEVQKERYKISEVYHIFPEYYFLKINQFNDIAKSKLDEWIYFLKNSEIKKGFSAKGLREANKALLVMKLSEYDQKLFDRYLEDIMYEASMYDSAQTEIEYNRKEGRKEGRAEGIVEGEKIGMEKGKLEGISEEKRNIARKLKQQGIATDSIAAASGLSFEEIKEL